VKSDSLSESLFGGGLGVVRDVVERRSGGSQLVGFVVEVLRHGRDTALVNSFVTQMAGDFLDSEHIETKMDRAMDAGPEVSLLPFGRWVVALEHAGEGVVDGLVVDEDVDWVLGRGDKVD